MMMSGGLFACLISMTRHWPEYCVHNLATVITSVVCICQRMFQMLLPYPSIVMEMRRVG